VAPLIKDFKIGKSLKHRQFRGFLFLSESAKWGENEGLG
jgi:hypothetical protein